MSGETYIDHYTELFADDQSWDENEKIIDHANLLSISTDTADYHIHPAYHLQETQIANEVFANLDGIVLETGSATYEERTLRGFTDHEQLTDLMEKNLSTHELPIYAVDVPAAEETILDRHLPTDNIFTKVSIRFGLLDGLPTGIGALGLLNGHPEAAPLLLPGVLNGVTKPFGKRGWLNQPMSYLRFGTFYNPISGGRSAFTAEKLEEHLSPYLADELEKKPQLLIEYGAGHLDIYPHLKHEKLRNSVLTLHQQLDYPWLQEDYENKALEYRFNNFTDGETEAYPDINDLEYQKIIHEFKDRE